MAMVRASMATGETGGLEGRVVMTGGAAEDGAGAAEDGADAAVEAIPEIGPNNDTRLLGLEVGAGRPEVPTSTGAGRSGVPTSAGTGGPEVEVARSTRLLEPLALRRKYA